MTISISGNRLSASISVKRFGTSDARNLDRHRPAAGPVEFGQNDALPGAEQHARIADLQRQGLTHHHPAQVRIGVLALAVGVARIVMAPIHFSRHYIFQKALHVVQQGVLPLVEKNGGGGMERLEMDNPVANAALADDLIDAVGDVDQLRAIARDPVEHPVKDLEPTRQRPGLFRYYFNFRDLFRDLRVRTHARSFTTIYDYNKRGQANDKRINRQQGQLFGNAGRGLVAGWLGRLPLLGAPRAEMNIYQRIG